MYIISKMNIGKITFMSDMDKNIQEKEEEKIKCYSGDLTSLHSKLSFTILNNLIQQFLLITDSRDAQKVANKAIKRVNSK